MGVEQAVLRITLDTSPIFRANAASENSGCILPKSNLPAKRKVWARCSHRRHFRDAREQLT